MRQPLRSHPFQRLSTPKEKSHLCRSGLSEAQQAMVLARLAECLHAVQRHFEIVTDRLQVSFDLSGTSAGQYRIQGRGTAYGTHRLRFNPYLLARHLDDSLRSTVPHEVAHFAVAMAYPTRSTRPHGPEWQQVMHLLGAQPLVTHRYALDGLPVRRQRRWRYRCDCAQHRVSTTRHNRIQRGTLYLCRNCGRPITLDELTD